MFDLIDICQKLVDLGQIEFVKDCASIIMISNNYVVQSLKLVEYENLIREEELLGQIMT